MSFTDEVGRASVPEEWRARGEVIRDGVTEFNTGVTTVVGTDDEILRQWGYDPEQIEILSTSQWRKEQPDGSWLTSYYFKHRPKAAALDLPALYAAAAKRPRKQLVKVDSDRIKVVVLSDVQAGKVGARGGTPELIDRLAEKREKLAALLRNSKPSRTVLVEAGDIFEGFESSGNPMFTNDLSLAQQMDLAATEVYEFVNVMHRHGRVDVMTCTSNHTAWRKGKQQLGRPSDDLGLHVHRTVEKVANAARLDAHWHYPAPYDESMILDVAGTTVGLVHGNQFSPMQAPLWWAKQQHGGQPIGAADILVTGHYHQFLALPTGRNPYTGRTKWWLQAPTVDNASDWFRNIAGDDSDPGLLVFDITTEGFDLQSLTVL